MPERFRIRPATLRDVEAIGHVHVASWEETYRGLMPVEAIARNTREKREELWRRVLSSPPVGKEGTSVFVAELGERVVGFGSAGPAREATSGYEGELYAVYLLKEAQGVGAGKGLFVACSEALAARGFRDMMLYVLASNARARAFYERMGGRQGASKTIQRGDHVLEEVVYGWKSVAKIPKLSGLVFRGFEGLPPEPIRERALQQIMDIFGSPTYDRVILHELTMRPPEDVLYQVVLDGDEVIASKIGYVQHYGKRRFYSWLGGVNAEYRRLGIAATLMRMQHRWCVRRGLKAVRTITTNARPGMLILNIQEGFHIIGTTTEPGSGEARIILQKPF